MVHSYAYQFDRVSGVCAWTGVPAAIGDCAVMYYVENMHCNDTPLMMH